MSQVNADIIKNAAGTGAPAFSSGINITPANMSDADATKLGLKEYVAGTSYNGSISPTVTGTNTWVTIRAVFIPYQMQDGSWRLKGNGSGTVASGSRAFSTFTVNGVVFKNVAYLPAGSGIYTASGGNPPGSLYPAANGAVLTVEHVTATSTAYGWSFDYELESKPTWAY